MLITGSDCAAHFIALTTASQTSAGQLGSAAAIARRRKYRRFSAIEGFLIPEFPAAADAAAECHDAAVGQGRRLFKAMMPLHAATTPSRFHDNFIPLNVRLLRMN